MKVNKKSQFFNTLFKSYFLILLVPILLTCSIQLWQFQDTRKSEKETEYNKSAQALQKVIEKIFENIDMTGYRLRNSTWLSKAYSNSIAVQNSFNATIKNEIYSQMIIYDTLIGVVDTTTVVLPEKNTIINRKGWYNYDSYLNGEWSSKKNEKNKLKELIKNAGYFNIIDLRHYGISPKNHCPIVIMQNLDTPSNSRAVLVAPLNLSAIDDYIKLYCPPDLVTLELFSDFSFYTYSNLDSPSSNKNDTPSAAVSPVSNTSSSVSNTTSKIHRVVINSSLFPITYTMDYDMHTASLSVKDYLLIIFCFLILTAIAFFVSTVLAHLTYKPLNNLVLKFALSTDPGSDIIHEFSALENIFTKLATQCDELSELVSQYYDTARNNILMNLISGYFYSDSSKLDLSKYEILFDNDSLYRVAIIIINKEDIPDNQRMQIFLLLRQALCQHLINFTFETIEDISGNLVIISKVSTLEESNSIGSILQSALSSINEKLKMKLYFNMGRMEVGLLGISRSYQHAKEIMLGNYTQSPTSLPEETVSYYYPTDWEMQLINYLKLGNASMAHKIIDELKTENQKRNLPQYLKIRLTFLIMQTLIRVVDELDFNLSTQILEITNDLTQLSSKKQWELISKTVSLICDRTEKTKEDKTTNIGKQMMDYIEQNYANADLSLQELSDRFDVSVSSASRIFKSVVKINFADYLCRIRIGKAKEYFRNGNTGVAKVSTLVGYDSDASFRRAFQRYEGISPTEYIKNHTK